MVPIDFQRIYFPVVVFFVGKTLATLAWTMGNSGKKNSYFFAFNVIFTWTSMAKSKQDVFFTHSWSL